MCNQLQQNNFIAYLILLLTFTLTSCSHTYPEFLDAIKDVKAEVTGINEKVGIKPDGDMYSIVKYIPFNIIIISHYKVKDIASFTQSVKSAALEKGYFIPNEEQLKKQGDRLLFLCSKKSKDRYLEIYINEKDIYSFAVTQSDNDKLCY